MADRLNGKVAILFGAGSVGPEWGNGKATAVLFARNGTHVACVDVNREAAQETVDIIPGEGGAATVFACDVTNLDAVKEVVDAVAGQHDRIDVLYNNLGYATMGGPIELDEASRRRTLDFNVTSCFVTCKHVLSHMLQRRSGAIANVSSVAEIRYTGYPISPITQPRRL
jgi:NAD(P)-dependent dehydrogenase (short-subunit alcohol dehydrogenase family)